jgi:hypothetical protein
MSIADLESADRWLTSALTAPTDDIDHYLAGLSPEWILDGLLGIEPTFRTKLDSEACYPVLLNYLNRQTGTGRSLPPVLPRATAPSPSQPLENSSRPGSWASSTSMTSLVPPHLEALKPLTQLSAPLLKTCQTLIHHLRDRHPDIYIDKAHTVAAALQEEFAKMRPEDLGKIDTFQQEEAKILHSAITALQSGQWQKAHDWATVRNQSQSFWLQRDRQRKVVWSLVEAAANLGCLITDTPTTLQSAYTPPRCPGVLHPIRLPGG